MARGAAQAQRKRQAQAQPKKKQRAAKKQPAYRLVVAESTAPRDGTFLENLGHYNPLTTPTTFVIKEDRVREWLQRGAQPTDRVARLLSSRGRISGAILIGYPQDAPNVTAAVRQHTDVSGCLEDLKLGNWDVLAALV